MARYDDITELEPDLDGARLRVGIVMSRFNIDVGEGLLASCTAELRTLGVAAEDILIVTVPGALEIPLAAQKMAAHLKAAGYPDADLHIFATPEKPKEGGLVAVLAVRLEDGVAEGLLEAVENSLAHDLLVRS